MSLSIHSRTGYVLQEIIVGVVIFGIAMLPIVRALRMVPETAAAVSEQARAEAWRTANDEAVGVGIDPTVIHVIPDPSGAREASRWFGSIVTAALPARAGAAQLMLFSESFGGTAEIRAAAAGFEVGPGSIPVPDRRDPLAPLPPITLAPPTMSPASGTFVSILSLSDPGVAGAPFVATLTARASAPGDRVQLRQSAPRTQSIDAIGAASLAVDAVELAQATRGRAWSEYAGDEHIDVPIDAGDGRTLWLVPIGDRTQVYEPSEFVDFVLGLDLGRPVYRMAGVQYDSGATVDVDYAQARAIEAGTQSAEITYPAIVRGRVGSAWTTVAPTYSWKFGVMPGDSSGGDTRSLYNAAGRRLWTDAQTLNATPLSGLAGLRLLAGSWTVERRATTLSVPERLGDFYDGTTDAPGTVTFAAPQVAELGTRIGRPSVDGVESISDTLSVNLAP